MKVEDSLTQRRQLFKQRIFLDHFKKWGIIAPCAEAAGVTRQLVNYWRETSPSFAKRMLVAANESSDYWDNFTLKSICELAREGNREMQTFIRKEHGEKNLKAIMRGMNLTTKDI